jgi:protein O-GlcNAc transferase
MMFTTDILYLFSAATFVFMSSPFTWKQHKKNICMLDEINMSRSKSEDEAAVYWMERAQVSLENDKDPIDAFAALAKVYAIDPTTKGLQRAFENCFRKSIQWLEEDKNKDPTIILQIAQERMGLAALLIDQERYDDAGIELRIVVSSLEPLSSKEAYQPLYEKASSMLYRTHAASCSWHDRFQDDNTLLSILKQYQYKQQQQDLLPPLHPFEALKWPCISLEDATYIAQQYSIRAEMEASNIQFSVTDPNRPMREKKKDKMRIKIGYISPDFTATHPLAFLMQHVFQYHNRTQFEVHVYSLVQQYDDKANLDSPEINAIRQGSDSYVELKYSASSFEYLTEIISRVQQDELDIVIDLCGYTGTSILATIMASRKLGAPIQISYMGFPGSSGSKYIDYLVVDEVAVPSSLRTHYTEKLIVMPHSYFVNSHKTAVSPSTQSIHLREQYGLPRDAFVFCCHSRADKIDPIIFSSWVFVLSQLNHLKKKKAVLWLLKSGQEMESNLRLFAERNHVPQDRLIFCNITSREEHIQRLQLADVFLDTPAYNAHTVGCDCLYAGVPMISLLIDDEGSSTSTAIATDKMPSRVGASLLRATGKGMEEFVVPTLDAYEKLMIRCVTDPTWFGTVRQRLRASIPFCPLFDTQRWVRNFERGLSQAARLSREGLAPSDIIIHEMDEILIDR